MDPRRILDKFLDEPGRGAGASSLAAAGITNIRDVTLDHLLDIRRRSAWATFFRPWLWRSEQLIGIFARRAEGAHVDVGERDFDCAGERGGVDQMCAAELRA